MVKMEMFFVIFGFMILGTFILNENKRNIMSNELLTYMHFANNAIAIADSYIEKINGLVFDEEVTKNQIRPDDFNEKIKLSSTLGKDANETNENTFDDVDDYNGYKQIVSVPKVGNFVVDITVHYFNTTNFQTTSSKEFYKLAVIRVRDTTAGSNVYYMGDETKKYEIRKEIVLSHHYFKH